MTEELRAKAEKLFKSHGDHVTDQALHAYFTDAEIAELQTAGLIVHAQSGNTWAWATAG